MAGLVPPIHALGCSSRKAWMPLVVSSKPLAAGGTAFPREPGSSPGMTVRQTVLGARDLSLSPPCPPCLRGEKNHRIGDQAVSLMLSTAASDTAAIVIR